MTHQFMAHGDLCAALGALLAPWRLKLGLAGLEVWSRGPARLTPRVLWAAVLWILLPA